MFRGEAVGVEDHFGGGEEGVGAVGEVGGAGVAVAAFDGDGVPAVCLHLRRMECQRGVICGCIRVYVRLGRCLFSAFGFRDAVLALSRSMSESVRGLRRSERWGRGWRALQELKISFRVALSRVCESCH